MSFNHQAPIEFRIGSEDSEIIDKIQNPYANEERFPIAILRSEARLLAIIKSEPGQPVKYYMNKCDLSYRGFFNALRVLADNGLVRKSNDSDDKRYVLIS